LGFLFFMLILFSFFLGGGGGGFIFWVWDFENGEKKIERVRKGDQWRAGHGETKEGREREREKDDGEFFFF
jgi:hypothetical protein